MAQNTASVTANRNTVPGTANEQPVAPPLFTGVPRREYTPDAKRMKEPLLTPELERARALFEEGNFAGARAEAKRVLRSKEASRDARMEAGDLLDRTAIDQGPLAAAVGFLILLGLLLMYVATNNA
jgi:hypothetical protein